ncbi:MAG: LuxR C-terminal-related transcriptional regulator [Thermomicrobiales bacterium]|nr:LuxR C-terminal-related transcriptional regulator [Thermomicrobiales bacterium]
MNPYATQRARDRIAESAGRGLDLVTFLHEVTEAMAKVVPHYMTPCWFTLDPTSLLVTSHYQTTLFELPPEWLAHEYFEDDAHKMADVARSERGVSTIHEATGGDPSRSQGWTRFVQPYGGDQELYVALRTRGEAWGLLSLYREPGDPAFDAGEITFLRDVSPHIAEGTKRGLLFGEASDPEDSEAPGLIILRGDWSVESLTTGAAQWLDELPGGAWTSREQLPPAVLAVAGRALRTAEATQTPGEVAMARVLSHSGRWVVLHGATLTGSTRQRVAVIIEPAHPDRISPLLMAAYELTEREQEVTRLVLQGHSTLEIANRLFVAPQTVQQHLKNVFDKTGVRSRRELVGKIFFAFYEPRVHDNEQRVIGGRPLRGGPMDPSTGV